MRPAPRIIAHVILGMLIACAAISSSCKSNSCVPGQQIACACLDGQQGVQACDKDGSRYLPCTCAAPAAAVTTQAVPHRSKKQIRCGAGSCDLACCATFTPPSCAHDPRACPRNNDGEAIIYECDGPEDCSSGQACCLVPGKTVIGAVCVPRSECRSDYQSMFHGEMFSAKKACHSNADCDVSEVCTPTTDGTGILTCNK